MKNLIFLLAFLISFSGFASVSILSDLDDTIKISGSDGNPTDLVGDTVFTGITEFFKGAKTYSNSLYILSASPTFMKPIIKNTLKKRNIEYKSLILRGNITEDKFKYKFREIKKILASSTDQFILIGDDLGKDPEVYAEIEKQFPDRILESYIHVVNGRSLPSEVVPYYTSFDLFMREYLANRMTPGWVEKGWESLILETKFNHIFPNRAVCPEDAAVYEWQMATHYQQEATQLATRLTTICQVRQSDNILP